MGPATAPHSTHHTIAAGDVNDDDATSQALKEMFGLSVKDQARMTPPEVGGNSDEEEDGGAEASASQSSTGPTGSSPSSGGAGSER